MQKYGRPDARTGGACSGYRWDANGNARAWGVRDCTYRCDGPKLYPGYRGQRCSGVTIEGAALDGVWA